MNTSGIRMLGVALTLLAGVSVFGASFAQSGGALKLSNTVYQDIEVKDANGKVTLKRVPAKTVVPGGEVVYEILYDNTGKVPAKDVAINNPVPAELSFVAVEGTPVTAVSVDGGKTFGNLADLTISQPDGTTRAAQPADVTDLRWVLATIQPGGKGKVSYRARVK
jgi:uncharacterized repeat protein (TIGR01451 family)